LSHQAYAWLFPPRNSLTVIDAVQALFPSTPPLSFCFLADLAPLTSPHATAACYYPSDGGQWQIDFNVRPSFGGLMTSPTKTLCLNPPKNVLIAANLRQKDALAKSAELGELCSARAIVRFGSKADICSAAEHVRFASNSDPKSGHQRTPAPLGRRAAP
jgi:hypothetical protein